MNKQINSPKTLSEWLTNVFKDIFIFSFKKLIYLLFNIYLVVYYILFIFLKRVITKKNPNQISIIQFALNWSVPAVFAFLIFYNFFKNTFHSLIFGNQPSSLKAIFTKSVINNQLDTNLFYGLIAVSIIFMIMNGILFIINSESIGSAILNRRLILKNGKEIGLKRKIIYLLTSGVMFFSFFIWPLFFSLWIINLSFRIIFNESILSFIFNLKFVNNTKKSFMYGEPKTIKWYKNNIDNKKNDPNVLNNIDHINAYDQSIKNINTNNYSSSVAFPRLINLIIYGLLVFFSCLGVGLYKFIFQNSRRFFSFIQYYFTGTINASGKNDFLVGTLNLFRNWISPDGSVINSFYGSTGTINYDFHSTNLSLTWIPSIHTWSGFWSDFQYIIFCILINFKLSPGPMIAITLLAILGLYFLINLLTLWIWGNTIFGFLYSGKYLLNKNTNKSLTFGGRTWYVFTYLIWIVLFFVPIINIIWIIANITCLFVHKQCIIDVMNSTYFGKNKLIAKEREEAISSAYNSYNLVTSKFRLRDIDSDSAVLDFNQKKEKASK